ncbi:MAG: hypothetical protein KAV87_02675, partial [Desulfobacteraceae bacterium]|nr:hypothetical protein [Desulfobacteraceae bacterium]
LKVNGPHPSLQQEGSRYQHLIVSKIFRKILEPFFLLFLFSDLTSTIQHFNYVPSPLDVSMVPQDYSAWS